MQINARMRFTVAGLMPSEASIIHDRFYT